MDLYLDLDVKSLRFLAALAEMMQKFDNDFKAEEYDLFVTEVEIKSTAGYVIGTVKFDDFDRWVYSPKVSDD